ncbi:putative epoxide hydrolase [Podospora aff. communis PSN243]|uniref:Epoxide hydrolase n=1 Tax=Podospora aff. communis PSN243 TaxID=3040156 RepID=A0AAV9GNC6_9PEZI|nr:putative epoxide hydrolase [Podospora aff. communis PSN243]
MLFSILPQCARQEVVRPFVVGISEEELVRLRMLLTFSEIPGPCYENSLPGGSRALGLPREWLIAAKRAWENEFDWKAHQDIMNSFPHFKVSAADLNVPVDDTPAMDIHFLAMFSTNPSATPVLLLHGWPGSFLEFIPMLKLLREKYPNPADLPYHIIVPSLPGFGFSGPFPSDRDHGMESAAAVMDKLMSGVLGFENYTVQGGDIGSRIGRILAARHKACGAALLNYSPVPQPPGMSQDDLTETEKAGIARGKWFRNDGCAYGLMQATRPATVGLVLSSNPLVLLAWIGEKYLDWIDPVAFPHDSVLESGTPYSRALMEQILLSISLYWFTKTAHTNLYTYRECFAIDGPARSSHGSPQYHIAAPKKLGFSYFPLEVAPTPKKWIETSGNLVYWKEHKVGGHFAALEQPASILEDLEEFIATCFARR